MLLHWAQCPPLSCVLCRSITAPSPERESHSASRPPSWSTRRATRLPMPSSIKAPPRCLRSTRSTFSPSTSQTSSQGPGMITGPLPTAPAVCVTSLLVEETHLTYWYVDFTESTSQRGFVDMGVALNKTFLAFEFREIYQRCNLARQASSNIRLTKIHEYSND